MLENKVLMYHTHRRGQSLPLCLGKIPKPHPLIPSPAEACGPRTPSSEQSLQQIFSEVVGGDLGLQQACQGAGSGCVTIVSVAEVWREANSAHSFQVWGATFVGEQVMPHPLARGKVNSAHFPGSERNLQVGWHDTRKSL